MTYRSSISLRERLLQISKWGTSRTVFAHPQMVGPYLRLSNRRKRSKSSTPRQIKSSPPFLSPEPRTSVQRRPDGHFAAVPIRATAGSIDIIDVPKRQIVKVLPINTPPNCYNNGSNEVIYCEARGDAQKIERIDLSTLNYTQGTPVGGDPRPFVVTRDGKKMYVALSQLHGFAAINIAKNDALQRVELPPGPPPPSPCEKYEPRTPTHGLDLSPDGKELWVTSLADSKVYVYDTDSKKISNEIPTGGCHNWISFSPDGKYVTVSNSATNDASIIDAKTRKEVARIKVGKVPKRLVAVNVPGWAAGAVSSASNVAPSKPQIAARQAARSGRTKQARYSTRPCRKQLIAAFPDLTRFWRLAVNSTVVRPWFGAGVRR